MSLVIGFRPGDALSIGGSRFSVDATTGTLTDDHGVCHQLSDTAVSPVTNVQVRLASHQRGHGTLSLAFDAPRNVLLLRHRDGGVL